MSNADLFLQAFSGQGDNGKREVSEAKGFSPEQRTAAFLAAFPAEREELPTAITGQNWRFDMAKCSRLSFTEQMKLEDLKGLPYRELPAYVIDGGLVKISDEEKAYQKKMQKETGYSQSERNQIFNVFRADVEALAEMAESEVLKGSAVLDSEFARIAERHGYEAVMDELQLVSPHARAEFYKRVELKRAEKAAEEARQQKSVAEEIAAAKAAIEAQNAAKDAEVKEIPTDALQAELTRRAAQATREAAIDQEG